MMSQRPRYSNALCTRYSHICEPVRGEEGSRTCFRSTGLVTDPAPAVAGSHWFRLLKVVSFSDLNSNSSTCLRHDKPESVLSDGTTKWWIGRCHYQLAVPGRPLLCLLLFYHPATEQATERDSAESLRHEKGR